jgi:hypothetical protein
MSSNANLNLKRTSRNPSSIANDEHNDASGAGRSANGDILCIDRIILAADAIAAAGAPIPERGTLRIANTSASWQFVYIGEEGTVPGTLDITNSMAVAPNSSMMLFSGVSTSDMKSLMIRVSAGTVQVIVMKP